MEGIREKLAALNKMIIGLQYLEALDIFYDDDVEIFENDKSVTRGLSIYKDQARKYIDSISNYEAEILDMIIGKDITACLWRYSFDHKEWGRWDREQLSVQRWRNGKIVAERHNYLM